jgi:hypothetical protein
VIGGNLIPSRFFKEAGLTFQSTYRDPYTPQTTMVASHPSRLGVVHGNTTEKSVISIGKIEWKPGDVCVHESFGRGKVKSIISSDIIEIVFDSPSQIKKLVAQHPKLKKVE